MGKLLKSILSTVCVLALLAGTFAAGYWYRGTGIAGDSAETVENTETDLTLPTEEEKRTVTKEEVEVRLSEVRELSTYSSEYTVEKSADFSRYVLERVVPGTTNTVDLTCRGIVKVGYDVDEIQVKVDNDSRKIYISLPEAKVNDNYIIWDDVQCTETNSILNPIDFAQYQTMISEIEAAGLQQAEADGIYEKAEESIETVIRNFLSGFDDFEVVFP